MRYATETSAIHFSFCLLSDGLLFSTHFFGPRKITLDYTYTYSLWFIQNFDETMTAGYFLGGGGEGGYLPPLKHSVLYFPKYNTPPRPHYHANIPPLQNIPRKYPDDSQGFD